jgi:hypothetical protein
LPQVATHVAFMQTSLLLHVSTVWGWQLPLEQRPSETLPLRQVRGEHILFEVTGAHVPLGWPVSAAAQE